MEAGSKECAPVHVNVRKNMEKKRVTYREGQSICSMQNMIECEQKT